MPNTAIQQQRLAQSAHFLNRVASSLANVAFQVIAEGRDNETEIKRYDYALTVLRNTHTVAVQIVQWLVERPNLLAATTSYNFDIPDVVTDATDAAIESQIASDWNILSGVTA